MSGIFIIQESKEHRNLGGNRIVDRARDKTKYPTCLYDLLNYNCEHFLTEMITRSPSSVSDQIKRLSLFTIFLISKLLGELSLPGLFIEYINGDTVTL